MIGKKMQEAINEQIKNEMYSSYLYLAMAAQMYHEGWDGMAKWFEAQAKEETEHAMKFFNHINERGGRVELKQLDKPQFEWASPLEAFKAAYAHEQFITARITDLYELAKAEKDYPAEILLQWFIEEQVEEEDNTSKIVQLLERIGNSGNGMIMLDVQLGKRE